MMMLQSWLMFAEIAKGHRGPSLQGLLMRGLSLCQEVGGSTSTRAQPGLLLEVLMQSPLP